MANPVFVTVTADAPTKVADSVTTGVIHKVEPGAPGAFFFHTYRVAGDPAPTSITDFGVRAFEGKSSEVISASEIIDVYLWLTGDEDGRVRVDV